MSSEPRIWKPLLLAVCALAGVQFACSSSGDDSESATREAMAVRLALTATAAANDEDEGSQSELQTAEAAATQQRIAVAATQTAAAGLSAEAIAATEAAAAPLLEELPTYGVDPSEGFIAWTHPPVQLEVEGYQQNASANEYGGTVVEDFVLTADITWNTQYGTSGCGFVFRSDGNQEEPNQYMVLISRIALGRLAFMTTAEGELANWKEAYPKGEDPDFDWRNDVTNRVTVVGRGTKFSMYTNGVFIREVDANEPPEEPVMPTPPPQPTDTSDPGVMEAFNQQLEQYEEEVAQLKAEHNYRKQRFQELDTEFLKGFVALVALSESGRTMCSFDNAWLFQIQPSP